MKKNRNKKGETPKEVKKHSARDGFDNPLGRLGMNQPGMMGATEYKIERLSRNYNLLNTLYRNSWIAKKIINTIPEDMIKNGYSITAELTPEQTDRFTKLAQRTKVDEKILEGLLWGRLYGGAGAIIMIDGDEDCLDEPLVVKDIMPNSFCGLMIVDRWSGIYPDLEMIDDIRDPEFGMPKYYEFKDNANGNAVQRVHHTRVIRFTGRKLPFWEAQTEIFWGASELEHVYEEIAKRDNTSWNIASLVFQSNLLVNKIDGLDQLLAVGDVQMQQDLYNVKSAQNQMRNNNGMMLIGKSEDITSIPYTFSGLNDIYQSIMMDVSGACDIPVTRLFGRSPSGMNATGEGDQQNYDDMIAQQQKSVLKVKYDKLLPIMFMSEFGEVPKDLDIKFNPHRTPSDDKVAEIVGKKVTSIIEAFNADAITQKIAMQELHDLSYTYNVFSNISPEDIEKADSSLRMSGEIMGNIDLGGDKETMDSHYRYKVHDEFKESDHPREDNGRFGNGSGSSKKINPNKIKEINPIQNKAKFEEITKSMKENGWQGRPLLVLENSGKYEALTGSHRLFASRKAGIEEVPTITIKPPNGDNAEINEQWNDLIKSKDDDDRERALLTLKESGEISKEAYELISGEQDINAKEYKSWSEKEDKRLSDEKTKRELDKKEKEEKQKKASKKILPNKREGYSDIDKINISSIFETTSFYNEEDFKKEQNPKNYYTIKNINEISEYFPVGMSLEEVHQEKWKMFGKTNRRGFYIKTANVFLPVYPKELIK